MSVLTQAALLSAANVIKDETEDGANTATRVGGQMENLLDTLGVQMDLDHRVVAGVIRNTGSGWELIGGDHKSVNVTSVDNTTSAVRVNFSGIGASDVVTFVVGCDETYAGDYFVGSSVSVTQAAIKIYSLSVSGSSVVKSLEDPNDVNDPAGNLWFIGIMKV